MLWITTLISQIGNQNATQRAKLAVALSQLVRTPITLTIDKVSKGILEFSLTFTDDPASVAIDPEHLRFDDAESIEQATRVFGCLSGDEAREIPSLFYQLAYGLMCMNAIDGRQAALPVRIKPIR